MSIIPSITNYSGSLSSCSSSFVPENSPNTVSASTLSEVSSGPCKGSRRYRRLQLVLDTITADMLNIRNMVSQLNTEVDFNAKRAAGTRRRKGNLPTDINDPSLGQSVLEDRLRCAQPGRIAAAFENFRIAHRYKMRRNGKETYVPLHTTPTQIATAIARVYRETQTPKKQAELKHLYVATFVFGKFQELIAKVGCGAIEYTDAVDQAAAIISAVRSPGAMSLEDRISLAQLIQQFGTTRPPNLASYSPSPSVITSLTQCINNGIQGYHRDVAAALAFIPPLALTFDPHEYGIGRAEVIQLMQDLERAIHVDALRQMSRSYSSVDIAVTHGVHHLSTTQIAGYIEQLRPLITRESLRQEENLIRVITIASRLFCNPNMTDEQRSTINQLLKQARDYCCSSI